VDTGMGLGAFGGHARGTFKLTIDLFKN